MIIAVLEGPAAGADIRARHRPVALHVEDLAGLEPVKPAHSRRLGRHAARFQHGVGGERRVPHRRNAGLAIDFAIFTSDQQLLDRFPRDRPVRMIGRVAERIEHHHAVGHRRIDGAEPVLAVQPLDHEVDAGLDRLLTELLRPEAATALEHDVERAEARLPHPFAR